MNMHNLKSGDIVKFKEYDELKQILYPYKNNDKYYHLMLSHAGESFIFNDYNYSENAVHFKFEHGKTQIEVFHSWKVRSEFLEISTEPIINNEDIPIIFGDSVYGM